VNGSSDEKNVFGTRATPRLLGAFFKTSCLDLKRALLVLVRVAQVETALLQAMVSDRLRDAAPMPTDDEPPSALFSLFAAVLPAVPFCCFLHPSALLWWFPVWVAVFYLPMPAMLQEGPKNFMLCTLAVYYSAHAEGWSTPRVLLGTAVLAQLMNLTHQALWDAAEPLLIGSPNHGRGRVVEHKMKSS